WFRFQSSLVLVPVQPGSAQYLSLSVSLFRYYSDIHSAASGCYQEMNSTLTELSGSFASEMNSLVALHELYKYINKYYDQVIMSLEEDTSGQKMQLAYRLQQVAALVENKVTDL
ncbi:PREDICTED: plexin-B3-like, partial [Poecilia mexicana]|uniref:plexin-B3-like n=1 Tax=Poecilia mexicana TaxID=48701 RepID=UPI00072E831E